MYGRRGGDDAGVEDTEVPLLWSRTTLRASVDSVDEHVELSRKDLLDQHTLSSSSIGALPVKQFSNLGDAVSQPPCSLFVSPARHIPATVNSTTTTTCAYCLPTFSRSSPR